MKRWTYFHKSETFATWATMLSPSWQAQGDWKFEWCVVAIAILPCVRFFNQDFFTRDLQRRGSLPSVARTPDSTVSRNHLIQQCWVLFNTHFKGLVKDTSAEITTDQKRPCRCIKEDCRTFWWCNYKYDKLMVLIVRTWKILIYIIKVTVCMWVHLV